MIFIVFTIPSICSFIYSSDIHWATCSVPGPSSTLVAHGWGHMLRNRYLQHSSSKLAKVCPWNIRFCIEDRGRLLGGRDNRAGLRVWGGALWAYTQGQSRRDIPCRKELCACERWQAGEPLGFTLTGHGAGEQERGSWKMQLDQEARARSWKALCAWPWSLDFVL